jgi:hypothetical protein
MLEGKAAIAPVALMAAPLGQLLKVVKSLLL